MNKYQSRNYALYRLNNLLHYIETSRPKLFEAINEDGTLYAAFFFDKWVKEYEDEGFTVREADIEQEIQYLKKRIEYYEILYK